eukprot:11484544-Alexandrium_andersonii.AAC.1
MSFRLRNERWRAPDCAQEHEGQARGFEPGRRARGWHVLWNKAPQVLRRTPCFEVRAFRS